LNDVVNGISAVKEAVGSDIKITVDEQSVTLPVTTAGNVEYVKVRPLFEGLGRNVTWYQASNSISVGWLK